jgi:hypothetical protein
MTTELHETGVRDFTLPEGCVVCGADLPVRVSEAGARGVCVHCGWMGRPQVTVTHRGLKVSLEAEAA